MVAEQRTHKGKEQPHHKNKLMKVKIKYVIKKSKSTTKILQSQFQPPTTNNYDTSTAPITPKQ